MGKENQMAITETAVRLRLDPSNWPEALDRKELSAPFALNKAIEEAAAVFAGFIEAHNAHSSSDRLTPAGVRAPDSDWANENLPPLRNRLAKIRETAVKVETNLVRELTADLAEPPTEPAT